MRVVAEAHGPGLHELSLRDLMDEYLVALEVGRRSRRTIDWYRAFLREYLDFAAHHMGRAPILADLTTVFIDRGLVYRPTRGTYDFALPLFGSHLWRRAELTELARRC